MLSAYYKELLLFAIHCLIYTQESIIHVDDLRICHILRSHTFNAETNIADLN